MNKLIFVSCNIQKAVEFLFSDLYKLIPYRIVISKFYWFPSACITFSFTELPIKEPVSHIQYLPTIFLPESSVYALNVYCLTTVQLGTTIVQLSIGRCSWLQNLILILFLANNCYYCKYRRQQIYVCDGRLRIKQYLLFLFFDSQCSLFGKSRFAFPHTSLPPYQGHLSWSVNFKTDRKTWYLPAHRPTKGGSKKYAGWKNKTSLSSLQRRIEGKKSYIPNTL